MMFIRSRTQLFIVSGSVALCILIATLLLFVPTSTLAATTITDCSSDAQLQASITRGGNISFSCGELPVTIGLSSPLVISRTVRINGQGKITLSPTSPRQKVFIVNKTGTLELLGVTVAGGGDNGGGSGLTNSGTVAITGSTFINNNSTGSGGAILNFGVMRISQSLFTNNNAAGFSGGGAIFNNGTLNITNTTITNNSTAVEGGGIFSNKGIVTLLNVTVTDNQARSGGQNIAVFDGVFELRNTLVSSSGINCSGSIASYGGNLASDSSCQLTVATDQQNTRIEYQSLDDNGGWTRTQALRTTSPALGAGYSCPAIDQRNFARPQTGRCDSGAFETKGTNTIPDPELPAESSSTTLYIPFVMH